MPKLQHLVEDLDLPVIPLLRLNCPGFQNSRYWQRYVESFRLESGTHKLHRWMPEPDRPWMIAHLKDRQGREVSQLFLSNDPLHQARILQSLLSLGLTEDSDETDRPADRPQPEVALAAAP